MGTWKEVIRAKAWGLFPIHYPGISERAIFPFVDELQSRQHVYPLQYELTSTISRFLNSVECTNANDSRLPGNIM